MPGLLFQDEQPQNKPICVDFNGGRLTSDAGVILLQQIDQKLQLTQKINACIADPRDPKLIEHPQRDLIAQRVYALAEGYEDLNDHDTLRTDPALLVGVKNHLDEDQPLGSAPTLCRLENRITRDENTALQKQFVEFFINSFETPPKELTLDFDATNDAVHGTQIGECFNGYYGEHCFLPLYVFCGTQLLWALLRSPKNGQAHHTLAVLSYLVKRLREAFPGVRIIFRADSGFYSPRLLWYCEKYGVGYIMGFSSNAVLKRLVAPAEVAAELFFRDAEVKESLRVFTDIWYQASTWKQPRRIIAKAERLKDGDNPGGKENTRFIVTNLEGDADELYEKTYCARGDMENRIKEQQGMLFADRTSCHDFDANQFRLLLASFAYVLMETLRRMVLCGTELATAQCDTIRLKLFKVAAVVKESVRRIVFSFSESYPYRELWRAICVRLASLRWSSA